MANKNDSFLSKHGDKINAAGHAINTLQNAKIAERQRKIAKLQIATAALQQEENELKKKELQLLEKQQKALEEEQRKARQEQKQKEVLKTELLDVAPKLNRILDDIVQTNYVNAFDRGKDLYEASSALAYLNEHKGTIEDINFHEYLYQIHEKLNKAIKKFRSDFDSFDNYLEAFYTFLEKHSLYFEVILIILGAKQIDVTQREEINLYEKTIQYLISQNELTSNLIASLQEYKELFLSKEFRFDDRFVPPPIQINEYNIILNVLKSIHSGEVDDELIEYRLKEIKVNYFVYDCIRYLKGTEISVTELQAKLELIEIDYAKEEALSDLRIGLKKYTQSVKDQIQKLKYFGDKNSYLEQIGKAESQSGISAENLIKEIEKMDKSIDKRGHIGTVIGGVSLAGIFIFSNTDIGENYANLSFILIIALAFAGYLIYESHTKDKMSGIFQPNGSYLISDKFTALSQDYILKVERTLVNIDMWRYKSKNG